MVVHAFKKSSLAVESAVLRMGFLSASNYTSRLPRVKVNKALELHFLTGIQYSVELCERVVSRGLQISLHIDLPDF